MRGPETRRCLKAAGVDCPAVYGTPAILLPLIVENDIPPRHEVGIVPHYSEIRAFATRFRSDPVHVIDVCRPFPRVLGEILSCRTILSSSLHGIVLAEAYGIPALLLTNENPGPNALFKYVDYFHSTDREPRFEVMSGAAFLDRLVDRAATVPLPRFARDTLLEAFPLPLARPVRTRASRLAESAGCRLSWSSAGQIARRVIAEETSA